MPMIIMFLLVFIVYPTQVTVLPLFGHIPNGFVVITPPPHNEAADLSKTKGCLGKIIIFWHLNTNK